MDIMIFPVSKLETVSTISIFLRINSCQVRERTGDRIFFCLVLDARARCEKRWKILAVSQRVRSHKPFVAQG